MIIYRGVGVACLIGALTVGGKPIYIKFKERIRKKNINLRNTSNIHDGIQKKLRRNRGVVCRELGKL